MPVVSFVMELVEVKCVEVLTPDNGAPDPSGGGFSLDLKDFEKFFQCLHFSDKYDRNCL